MGPGWGGALVLEASPVALGCAEDHGKAYQQENYSGRTPHTVKLGPDLTEPGTFLEGEGLDKEGRQGPAGLEERLDHSVGLCAVSCGAGKGAVRGLGLHLGRPSGTGLCSGGGLGSVSQRGKAPAPTALLQGARENTPPPQLWMSGRLCPGVWGVWLYTPYSPPNAGRWVPSPLLCMRTLRLEMT